MPIIQNLPCANDDINYENAKIIVESSTREQKYSTSSSSTVTTCGSVKFSSLNQFIIVGYYSSNLAEPTDQRITFYATENCTATITRGGTASQTTSVGALNLIKDRKYTAQRYAPSSKSEQYFKITDDVANTEILYSTESSNGWKIIFT